MTTSPRASQSQAPQAMDEPPNAPDAPETCPACGEFLVDSKSYITIIFVCGQVMNLLDGEWKPNTSWECACERSFSAAIALRARVAKLESEDADATEYWRKCYLSQIDATDLYRSDLSDARAERDAALARLAELQAVCDAARKYSDAHHFELINGNKLLYCVDKQDDYKFDAALAALSRAVVEGETTK